MRRRRRLAARFMRTLANATGARMPPIMAKPNVLTQLDRRMCILPDADDPDPTSASALNITPPSPTVVTPIG
jgi:hypothetical protein